MADEKKIIEIQVELTDQIKAINSLTDKINELKKAEGLEGEQLVQNQLKIKEYTRQRRVLMNEAGREIQGVQEAMGAYQKLQTEYTKASQKAKDLGAEYGVESEKAKEAAETAFALGQRLKDVDVSVNQNTRSVGDYENAIRNALGPMGAMIENISQTITSAGGLKNALAQGAAGVKAFGVQLLKLLANPVVAIIAAIVGAFLALKAAIAQNGEATEKLNQLLAPFKALISGVVNVIGNLATALINGALAVGEFATKIAAFIPGLKTVAKETQNIIELERERQRLAEEERADTVDDAKTRLKIAKLKKDIARADKFTNEERIKMAREADRLEQENMMDDLQRATRRLQNVQKQYTAEGKAYEDLTEQQKQDYRNLEAELFNLKAEYLERTKRLGATESTLVEEIEREKDAARKKAEEADKKRAQDRKKRMEEDLQYASYMQMLVMDDMLQQLKESDDKVRLQRLKSAEETAKQMALQTVKSLDNYIKSIKDVMAQQVVEDDASWNAQLEKYNQFQLQKADIELATAEARGQSTLNQQMALLDAQRNAEINNARLTNDERQRIEEYYTAKRQEIKRQELNSALSATGDMFGAVAALFEENTTEYKVFATAQALMNTYLGITNALAQTKGGIVAQIAGVVAAAATGFAAVRNIWKVKTDGSGVSPSGNGSSVATVAKLPPDTASKMAAPIASYVSPTGVNGGSAAITSGAATSISTGGLDVMRALANLPQPIVTVKDIDIATKRVQVVDKLNRV